MDSRNRRNPFPDHFDVDLNPIRDFMKQMDSFFNESFKQMNTYFHLKPFWVETKETDNEYMITAELPDVKRDQIRLEILDNKIRIAVQDTKSLEGKDEKNNLYNKQNSYQKMERIVALPFLIPEEKTKASFHNGILKIRVPKKNTKRKYLDIMDDK